MIRLLVILLLVLSTNSWAGPIQTSPGGGGGGGFTSLSDYPDICGGSETIARNAGDTANECASIGSGSGDSITVAGSSMTDANILDSTWVDAVLDTAPAPDTVTFNIISGSISATELGADSVSASELNATGVEAELEAVMDLQDMQGAVTDAQVPDGITVTSAASAAAVGTNAVAEILDIAAAIKSGADGKLITGTATSGECAQFNVDGDIVGAGAACGSGGGLDNVVEDITPTLGGPLDAGGFDITNGGVITLTEQAAAEADVAGQGQLWVKTATPNQLWFTDDAGTDVQLGLSGSGDIATIGDCITDECFEGTSGAETKLLGLTDLIFEIDADSNGTETFQIMDGASTVVAEVSEAGALQIDGDFTSDGTGTQDFDGAVFAPSFTADASATPSLELNDSDSASEATDASIVAAATDTGAGTEDVDLTLNVQVNSTLTARVTIDADGNTTIPNLDVGSTGVVYSTGTLSSTDLEVLDDGLISSAEMDTELRSMNWGAGSWSTDGTNCAAPTEATINSGPKLYTVICTENDASTLYGSTVMPDSWDGGTIDFELTYIQTAADTGSMFVDVAAQCRGNGEVPSATYGTEAAIDDAAVVGSNSNDQARSGAVTPAGTCAGGDALYWRIQVDATSNPTTAAATLHFTNVKVEYTSNIGDTAGN